jgi:hypothetical protein
VGNNNNTTTIYATFRTPFVTFACWSDGTQSKRQCRGQWHTNRLEASLEAYRSEIHRNAQLPPGCKSNSQSSPLYLLRPPSMEYRKHRRVLAECVEVCWHKSRGGFITSQLQQLASLCKDVDDNRPLTLKHPCFHAPSSSGMLV